MHWLELGCVMCLVACSGSSTRHFQAQDGGAGSGGTAAGTGGTAQSGGSAGTGGASSGGSGGKGGSSAQGGSGGNAMSGAAGAPDAGGTGGAGGSAGAPPAGCSGPPRCSVAAAQVSCQAISGCFWTQCTQRNQGFVYGCGTEGRDAAGNCPPGCTFDTGSGNCVGNGDYYGSALPCGDAARQTQDTCVGVGFLWQSCTWQTAVGCYGTPTRQDCTGLPDEIICIQQGCTWN